MRQENHSLRQELDKRNATRHEREMARSQELLISQMAAIFALAKLTESRDDETGGHLRRVERYCRLLAESMVQESGNVFRLSSREIDVLCRASVLHDIGKVGVRDDILLKPGRLTDEEFAVMKKHTTIGADILDSVRQKYPGNVFIVMGVIVARSHHERWDGTGYPDRLCDGEIPPPAVIMAIADVYDALRSRRCYKEPISHEEACEIIREGSGTQFHPKAVDAFLATRKQFQKIRQHLED
ncbi:MAG: HD domain-containing phosphohydrolase [Patescibacteria group bacterium]